MKKNNPKGIIKINERLKNYKTEKGITLIALIITIIVLLILAGVTITIIVGPNGILKRAEETAKLHKIQEIQERLELEKGPVAMDNKGKTTIEDYLEHIVKEGIINKEDIANTEDEKSKYITVEDQYVYLVEEEKNGNIKIIYLGELGNLAPEIELEIEKITTNEIVVKVNALRIGKGKYEYYIKDIISGEEYKLKQTATEEKYAFTGLKHNTEYKIKVIAKNIGQTAKETGIIRTVTLEDLIQGDIEFTYNPTGWTNGNVTVTAIEKINIPKEYRLQTSKDANSWSDETSQQFTQNGEMYVRIWDGINESGYAIAQVTKIDKLIPKVEFKLSSTTTDTVSSVTANITITDEGGSEIDLSKCRWIYTTQQTNIGNNPASYTGGEVTKEPIKLESNDQGKYYLHVLCADKAGNIKEYISQVITVNLKTDFLAEGLIQGVEKIGTAGNYKITVNNVIYNLHVYYFNGNQVWDTNQTFGDDNDVAKEGTTGYAKNMVVVKVKGNLTINSGVTVEPYSTVYGGPKGFFIYCTGTLTNNGIITTTAKGAKAEGENVYLYKNSDNTYEIVPAVGASGGDRIINNIGTYHDIDGRKGSNGSERQTAGGGSGGSVAGPIGSKNIAGGGASGTSYSGGPGGGGSWYAGQQSEDGAQNGGKGGNGAGTAQYTWGVGGGAGNPGGTHLSSAQDGKNGTGGLLIIYANIFCNKGQITSDGSKGGNAYRGAGGGSGGGSINIFYNTNTSTSTTITANGGAGGTGTRSGGETANGGAGGTGTITKGNIKSGKFVKE